MVIRGHTVVNYERLPVGLSLHRVPKIVARHRSRLLATSWAVPKREVPELWLLQFKYSVASSEDALYILLINGSVLQLHILRHPA